MLFHCHHGTNSVAAYSVLSFVFLLLLERGPLQSSASVTIGVVYRCSYRWDTLAETRRCPPNENTNAVSLPSCFLSNHPHLDQDVCGQSSIHDDALGFLHRVDSSIATFAPHCVKYGSRGSLSSFVNDMCNSPATTSHLTMRQVFDHAAGLVFVDDPFVENEKERRRAVASLTAELLCSTWTDSSAKHAFMQPSASSLPSNSTMTFNLRSYLHCAGDLHRAALNQGSFIDSAKKLYLAAEILTTILAVFAFFWNLISIIGVCYASGLSRFRRALLINLCVTDLVNGITICVGEHIHLARQLDHYYFLWNVLTFEMVLTLCLLTLDFNLAIFKPLRYRYLVSRAAVGIIISASWVLSCGLSLAFVFGARRQIRGLEISALCFYLLSILLVFVAHIVLLLKIFHIQTESQSLVINVVGTKRIIEQTNRVASTVVLVAVTTLVLVIPYCIYEIFLLGELSNDDAEQCYIRESKLLISELSADICLSVNCVIDPLLYVLRLSDVRRGVQRAWRKLCNALGIQHVPLGGSGSGSGSAPTFRTANKDTNSGGMASSSSAPLLIYRPANSTSTGGQTGSQIAKSNSNSSASTSMVFNNRRPPIASSRITSGASSSGLPSRMSSNLSDAPLLPQRQSHHHYNVHNHKPTPGDSNINNPDIIESTRL